ncbi:hypothetical protein [Mycobacterium arosiense]|uniref:Uncharacterized protein n=1 Tax=Mycobacterium arosiense ATCC BAA-1401 = DSM 45069 TaxID=1265311 RepID=A0A1W9ZC06_MYCAI|nr:hypothetical protein [Mycobacterium arosiense]ORA11389.1 hypothetical protein BST14_18795 [Mycobacterium arosiense ATCC BAA-1401 = DSM 45069]
MVAPQHPEVVLLTAGAQSFFPDDTLDSDVTQLLAPHATGAGLAEEIGVGGEGWSELTAALGDSSLILTLPSDRRDDYALAAGAGTGPRGADAVARGVTSIAWSGVPPAVFDAGENTVERSIEARDSTVVAVVQAAVIGPDPATGIAVRLSCGAIEGHGALEATGRAALPLADGPRHPLAKSAAWGHDWSATSVLVGAETTESPEIRERARRWARSRLDSPPRDAVLAEILASESSY